MPSFLQNLIGGAKGFLGNLFGPQTQQSQQVVSPLPNEYSRSTMPQGFIGPTQQPAGAVSAFQQSQQPQPQIQLPSQYPAGFDPNGISQEAANTEAQVNAFLNSFINPVSGALDSWRNRLQEFDKNNPFAFDEALAKASAGQRLNPYYDATLNEFMTGIRRSSSRSVEDMTRTIGELNVDATKLSDKERLSTQEAIRQSEEGAAGAGLFFSGQRQRQTNLQDIAGNQAQEGIQTGLERNIGDVTRTNTRTQEDLALQQSRQKRLTEAERTTALSTDVANQQREAEIRRAQERLAYAGPAPGSGSNLSLNNQLFGMY
jgi:hypothetical protein